jgi:hypothetical protein
LGSEFETEANLRKEEEAEKFIESNKTQNRIARDLMGTVDGNVTIGDKKSLDKDPMAELTGNHKIVEESSRIVGDIGGGGVKGIVSFGNTTEENFESQ